MQDREVKAKEVKVIVGLLEQAAQRLRAERRMTISARIIALALLLPVTFKLIDLVSPFRGRTVAIVLSIWSAGTAAWLFWKTRDRSTPTEAAAGLDRAAKLQDEMKTAYWFIQNPSPSEWVAAQIRKAAETAGHVHVATLFPREIPRSVYPASGLILALIVLNFLPLSGNHNWFAGEGAPPFRLSRSEQALAERAKQLLAKSPGSEKLAKIISDLQNGKISSEDAQQQIADMRQQLDDGNLELNNILDGLTAMANQLGQSPALASAAEALSQADLAGAAGQIRELGGKLGMTPSDVLHELQKNMSQAAADAPTSLQDIAKAMQEAAGDLKTGDVNASKEAFDKLAQAMEGLDRKMDSQQRQSQAGLQLGDLQQALQQDGATARAEGGESSSGGGSSGGSSSGSESGTGASSANNSSQGGKSTAAGGPSGPGTASATAEEQQPGERTSLDVQLKKEGIQGQASTSGQTLDTEAASKQARSAMDYRNVPSQLSPAQKDALNQNRLPREQREIVKDYFDEIRPKTAPAIKQ